MTKIAYGYLAVLPYINAASLFLLMKNGVDGTALIIFFIILAVTCLIGVGVNFAYNVGAIASENSMSFALRNLALKIVHIPVHLLVLVILMGFMNPFLLLASWIPAMFGIGLLIFDGFTNVGACAALYLRKKCKVSTAILLGMASFIYIVDIIGAVIQIKDSKERDLNVQ